MTKLTPYGRALAWTGLILIAATVALIYLYTRPDPLEAELVVDYQDRIAYLEREAEEYRQAEFKARTRAIALQDSLQSIRRRMLEQTEKMTTLKNQANAANAMDYRRYTDTELERILSTRYQSTPGQ